MLITWLITYMFFLLDVEQAKHLIDYNIILMVIFYTWILIQIDNNLNNILYNFLLPFNNYLLIITNYYY